MTERIVPTDQVSGYELSLDGHLDDHWYDWVAGLTMTHEPDGTTTLRSPALDQAALHGLLARVRDLGATLLSVRVLDEPATTSCRVASDANSI
jgi:hypothetical protein